VSSVEPDSFEVGEGNFWLIYDPEHAQPNSAQVDSYVVFSSQTSNDGNTHCSYTTIPDWPSGSFMPPGKFPPNWIDDGDIHIHNWFSNLNDLEYEGAFTLDHIDVDVWESEEDCSQGSSPSDLPCHSLAVFEDTNRPLQITAAHKQEGDFDSDWVTIDWWNSFETTNIPDIVPPSSHWTTSCYNTENGFVVSPERGFVSTKSKSDNFTIHLRSEPVSSLGPVTVQFQTSPLTPPTVTFVLANGDSASSIEFDNTNWDDPVRIFLKYKTDGETNFNIVATGGGYDIPFILLNKQNSPQTETRSASFRAVSCVHGQVGL